MVNRLPATSDPNKKTPGQEGIAMLKYLIIAALVAPSAALAMPAAKQEVTDAIKREQRIKDLSEAPASVKNICKRC